MRSLAIETSGRLGSVALVEHGKVVGERAFSHGLKHAAGLLPLIDGMMRPLKWTPVGLKELYVSRGPGSFTGLRIGITLAKTLAFTNGAKIVPVPSLHVLAYNAPVEANQVIIVLDAKRDQIFTARYQRAGEDWIECEPAHLDSLSAMLDRSPRPVHLIGEGIPYHAKFLPPDAADIIVTPDSTWHARAAVVAMLGMRLAYQGKFVTADQFTPAYVRIPEAEEKYNQQHPIDLPIKSGYDRDR